MTTTHRTLLDAILAGACQSARHGVPVGVACNWRTSPGTYHSYSLDHGVPEGSTGCAIVYPDGRQPLLLSRHDLPVLVELVQMARQEVSMARAA